MHACGQGHVVIERCHPAFFTRSPENANRWRELVRQASQAAGSEYKQHNFLRLRRGPNVIAAVLDESVDERLEYTISSPEGVFVSTRILLAAAPQAVFVDGQPCEGVTWDNASHTVLIRHPGLFDADEYGCVCPKRHGNQPVGRLECRAVSHQVDQGTILRCRQLDRLLAEGAP